MEKRTHCPNGHLIAGANEVLRKGGHRCRICFNEYARLYQARIGFKHSNAYKARKRSEKSALEIG